MGFFFGVGGGGEFLVQGFFWVLLREALGIFWFHISYLLPQILSTSLGPPPPLGLYYFMARGLFLEGSINKLTSVFNASVLLLIMNFVITLSK